MDARSTASRFTHFQGEVIAEVESSHGVRLRGGSTGGVVEPFGDDTGITLTVQAKQGAGLVLGSTAGSSLALNSSVIDIGNQSTRIDIGSSACSSFSENAVSWSMNRTSSGSWRIGTTGSPTGLLDGSSLRIGSTTSTINLQASTIVIGSTGANVTVRGGTIGIGSTASTVTISGSTVTLGSTNSVIIFPNSTTPITRVRRYDIAIPASSYLATERLDSTFTVTGATTNAAYVFCPRAAMSANNVIVHSARCSSADEVTISFANVIGSTQSASTNSGWLLQIGF